MLTNGQKKIKSYREIQKKSFVDMRRYPNKYRDCMRERQDEGFVVKTNQGDWTSDYVINAAGVHADKFYNMVSEKKIHSTPRRGEYLLLDKTAGKHVKKTIFSLPSKFGKGVLVTPTIHGNLLVGPTAMDLEDKEATCTSKGGMEEVMTKAGMTVRNLPLRQAITSFAGLRAHEDHHEFILGEVEDTKSGGNSKLIVGENKDIYEM